MKNYNIKSLYNVYVKISQAHFIYQPHIPKTISCMPFDWLEVQNLLEDYMKENGADFDKLANEYKEE